MKIDEYVLVPGIVNLRTNVNSIRNFMFGFRFENNNMDSIDSKIKLTYMVVKYSDILNELRQDYYEMYYEILVNDSATKFAFVKELFHILKVVMFVDISNIKHPIVKVNTSYHMLFEIIKLSNLGHIYSPGVILHNILGMSLIMRGYIPLCGSAIELCGKTFLIFGISGSGKSTLILKILKLGGKVIGDDIIVVSKEGKVYGSFHLPYRQKNIRLLHNLGAGSVTNAGKPLTLVNVFGKENVSLSGNICRIVFIEKGARYLGELPSEEALTKVLALMKGNFFYETIPITQAMILHNKGLSKVSNYVIEELGSIIKNVETIVIRGRTVEDLSNLLIKLIKGRHECS